MSKILKTFARLGWTIIARPKTLYYELNLSETSQLKIWDRPGKWCTENEIRKIVEDLRTIVKSSQEKNIPEYGVLLGEKEDLQGRLISIFYQDNVPVGFSAQAHFDLTIGLKHVHVIHLGLLFIDKKVRGEGLSGILYAFPNLLVLLKSGLRSHWISNVTQVPAVFGLVEDFYSNAFPNSKGQEQTFEHYCIGNHIISTHKRWFGVGEDSEYDSEEQIIKNSYTGGSDHLKKTYEETAKYRNPVVNELLKEKLDYYRGDDYLQLAILDYKLIFKYLGSKEIKSKYGSVFLNFFFILATSLLVPLFRWIVPLEEHDV